MKARGKPGAGKPHAGFDVAGVGNVAWLRWCDTRERKGEQTENTNLNLNRRANIRPYRREAAGNRCPKGNMAPVAYFYRSVKYRDIYLKAYDSLGELRQGLRKWFDRYDKRRHQSLDNRAPNEVYWSTLPEARDVG
jgi:hypothetical protein